MAQVRGRPLHFGIQLPGQCASWVDYAQAVQTVEDLGFGSVWTFDHLMPFSGPDDRPCFEALTTLAAVSVLTARARIGMLVGGVLYRDPVTLAKAAAQVDEMSGGRLEFSLGAAWAEREFKAYGLGFPPLEERYARLDEALQIVKHLWGHHRTTFRGRFYQVDNAPCEPKPVQLPHPPITIGGTGRGSLRIAARHASRINLIGPPAKCAERAQMLQRLCREVGRDFGDIELSVHPTLALAQTHDQAQTLARSIASSNSTNLEAERDNWVIGEPGEVVERLRDYLAVGVSHFVFASFHPFDREPLELLRNEVIPALV